MNYLRDILAELEIAGLIRSPATVSGPAGSHVIINGEKFACFCSNDYLGLASHPALGEAAKAAIDNAGFGSGASRLVCGTNDLHRELERKIASFKGTEDAVIFPTGYMANVGTISALAGRGDVVFCDRLNHASIFDGCRLSGADLRIYQHKDAAELEKLLARHHAGRKLVVTDSVFSMDGDIAPLAEIAGACERHGAALMVDEAHATGVLGEGGRGAAELLDVEKRITVKMGTLSKAAGSLGGFIAGSNELISVLKNLAKSFIYTTALPPGICAASIAAIEIIEREPERRQDLFARARRLQDGLRALGLDPGTCETPITRIIIGSSADAVAVSKKLYDKKILAPAIRPPTVPDGTARIRLTPTAAHTKEDVDYLLAALRQAL